MGFRARPLDIEIPEDKPFRHDLLGRREPAESLANLIGSVEGPCAVSVDAAWGNGKSTFLKLLAQHLRNEGFPVVAFNAWETDFSGDPFLALSESIASGLESYGAGPAEPKLKKFKEAATETARHLLPAAIRVGTAGLLDVGPLLEKELGGALAAVAKDRLAAYGEARKTVAGFTEILGETAKAVSREGRPLVVTIDELDRCRPSYAVELLEVAKHLFSVDRVVFVLAVNRAELEHSVKALYGAGFDARGYLGRFFDVAFRLPEPDRRNFVRAIGEAMQFPHRDSAAYEMTTIFFGNSNLTLRQIQQAMYYVGLVQTLIQNEDIFKHIDYHAVIIARALAPDLYYSFCEGHTSDRELVEYIDKNTNWKSTDTGVGNRHYMGYFEASIICAYRQFHSGGHLATASSSPLLDHYEEIFKNEEYEVPELVQHARNVKGDVERRFQDPYYLRGNSTFHNFARQIELYGKRR